MPLWMRPDVYTVACGDDKSPVTPLQYYSLFDCGGHFALDRFPYDADYSNLNNGR